MTVGPNPVPQVVPAPGTKIYLKRTQTLNNTPGAGDIEHGELWMNYHSSSPRLYFKDNANEIVEIKPGAAAGEGVTPPSSGNETGDLWFDGTNLLVWNGSSWQVVGVSTLAALNDTDVAGATANQLLAYDGSKWVAVSASSIAVDVNLGYTASPTQGVVTNDAGSDATIPARTNVNAGLMLPADKTAIDGLPADFDFLRAGDDVSELTNDAGYLTESEVNNILQGNNPDGSPNTGAPGYLKPGDNVSELTNDAGYITLADVPDGVENLDDLGDVSVPAPTSGQILKYNGAGWVAGNPAAADISGSELNDLGDVNAPSPGVDQHLAWNGSSWIAVDPPDEFSGSYNDLTDKPVIPGALNDLSDVDATPTDGQHLAWDDTNSKWVAEDPPAVGGGGTVTSVGAGDGLATDGANPITGAGTLKAVAANATITVTAGGIAVTPGQYFPAAGGELDGVITTPEKTITSLAFDLSEGPFWTCGSIDVPNPTNAVAGMSGLIRFTGPPTSWGFNFKFVGGTGVAPSGLPAVSPFYVKAADEIYVGPAVEELI